MANFFENLAYGAAMELEQLAQLIHELRENRNAVLKHYEAADEAALLARIRSGAVAEHPAYEYHLAARILADTLETARAVAAERMQEASRT